MMKCQPTILMHLTESEDTECKHSSSAISEIINKCQSASFTGSHAQAITEPPPCLTDEVVYFGSWACTFSAHFLHHFDRGYFFFHHSLEIYSRTCLKRNLTFLFLNFTQCLINPLRLWSSLDRQKGNMEVYITIHVFCILQIILFKTHDPVYQPLCNCF